MEFVEQGRERAVVCRPEGVVEALGGTYYTYDKNNHNKITVKCDSVILLFRWFELRPLKIALQDRIQKSLTEIVISHHENIIGIRTVGDSNGFTGNHG